MDGRAATNDRVKGALGALLLQGALGYALIMGLGVPMPPAVDDSLKVFGVAVEPPPEPTVEIIPDPQPSPEPEGEAAPPNLRSTPTPVVAPEPVVVLPVTPPIVSAPVAGVGSDPSAGAADVPGPGTGAGGQGDGRGSGGSGDGTGGRPLRDETPPFRIRGDERMRIPDWAWENGMRGYVMVDYAVQVNGRVSDCVVVRSSGYPRLDAYTCQQIERHFHYRPSRDGRGRPVHSTIVDETHEWGWDEEPEMPRRRR